jgi:hypothetical protein
MAKDRDPAGLESRRRDLGSNAALAPGQVPGDTVTAPSIQIRVQPIEPTTCLSAPLEEDLHTIFTRSAPLLHMRELRCSVSGAKARRGNRWRGPAAAGRCVLLKSKLARPLSVTFE